MASARSRKILDLIDNKGSPHYQEHDQANTVPNEPVQNSGILSDRSIDVQTNIVPNEPEQHSEILSDKSIHVQVLHDVRNKPENCTFLNAQEYFNDTEHQDSPTPKLDDQVFMTIPLTATTNINCSGKPFHCVNSTHFMICVDLGSGISSTIDDFIIPCPPTTVCQPNNSFECEFPFTEELPPPLDVIGVSTTSDISTLPSSVHSLTTPTQTEQITAQPKEKQNLTLLQDITSSKFSEILENLKEEFTGGNETFFHVIKTIPSSTISPIDNMDAAKYDANKKTTDKLSNSRATESVPLYGIEAIVTENSQTMSDVRTFDPPLMKTTEVQSATKVQIESSTALPSTKEPLPKENTMSKSLNKEQLGDDKHRKMILSPSNIVSSITNLSETTLIANNATNNKHTTNSTNHQSVHAIESNLSDNSQTLIDAEAFDLMLNNIPKINQSTTKIPIESSTALPITENKIPTLKKISPLLFSNDTTKEQIRPTNKVPIINQNLTTLVDLPLPKLQEKLEDLKDEFTGGNETYFQKTTAVPRSTKPPSETLYDITTTKYDTNAKFTNNKILHAESTTESAPVYELRANVTDNLHTTSTVRTFNMIPIKNAETQSATEGQQVALPKVKNISENFEDRYIGSNVSFFQMTLDSPGDIEVPTNGTNENRTSNLSNPQSIISSASYYAIETNTTDNSEIVTNAFDLMLDNVMNINQSTTKDSIESSTALPITDKKISIIKERNPLNITDSVTTKQISSTTVMPILKQNLSTLADLPLPKQSDISKTLQAHVTTILPRNMLNSTNYLHKTTAKNDDVMVTNTDSIRNFQSASESAPLYTIEPNVTDNSQNSPAAEDFDSIHNYITVTNQSLVNIPIESITASPIPEQKLPIIKEFTSPAVIETLGSLKDIFTGGNETYFHVLPTLPGNVKNSSDNLNGNQTAKNYLNEATNKTFDSHSATEPAPRYVIDVAASDNSQSTDIAAVRALNTISKNVTDFQLQDNHNLLAIPTTSRPANNTKQSSVLFPTAPYKASNTVVQDNLIPTNIVLNISNPNEMSIKENKTETTTNHIASDRFVDNPPISNIKDIAFPQEQFALNIETSEKLSDHVKISSNQPLADEKTYIKGLDAKHMPSITYSPSTNFDKTVNIESSFSVHTPSTPRTTDTNPRMSEGTTLQSINYKNDKVSELAPTIPMSYTDEIYKTTPNPLYNTYSTKSSSNNDNNKNLNSLNGVTETMSTLVNYSPDIIYDPDSQTVTPISEVNFRHDYITSKSMHLLSTATHSNLPPTTGTKTVQAYTPQYSILINDTTQHLQRNFTITDRVVEKRQSTAFATEQRRNNTNAPAGTALNVSSMPQLGMAKVQNSIHTSTEPNYSKPIGLSRNKASAAHNLLTNSYTDTESSGIEMGQNKNTASHKAMISDPIDTRDEINSTILTANEATDTKGQDNKNEALALDILKPTISGDLKKDPIPKEITVVPTIVNNINITDYNFQTTSIPPFHEVSITKAKTNGVLYTDQHSVITDHNFKNDNNLITSIKPVTMISISNATDNPLGIETVILKPSSKNILVPRTRFATHINTLNTPGNEVLTTTEATISHSKGEITRKSSGIIEANRSTATTREVNHNLSASFIAEKSEPTSLVVNKTQISNEDVHSTEKSFRMTADKIKGKSNVPSRIEPIFIITTENPEISLGFDKLIKIQTESISTTENIENSNYSNKTVNKSVNKLSSIKENMTNPSNINNITLGDIIVMNQTGNVSYLWNMAIHANTTAQKEALQKDTPNISLYSKRAIDLNNREEINQIKGSDPLTENPINIELSIDKKRNAVSHENNDELSTSYFEVTSYTDITTPDPLFKKGTSFDTGKHTKGIETEMKYLPDNLYQQQNLTNTKKLLSNVQVNKISNKEEIQINYEQKDTTSNTNSIKVITEANINKTASLYDCWNNTRGKYADKKDCRKFYICFGKLHPIVGTCPENTVFSEINKQCTRNLSHCVRNNQFHCLYEGRFSDMLKDNIYYICVKHNSNFLRYKLQCQFGYHLNKATVKCEKNDEKLSQSTSSSASENSQINDQSGFTGQAQSSEQPLTSEQLEKPEKSKISQNKKEFECKTEGKFQYPQDCSKYYVCYKNKKNEYRRKIKICSDDKVYDKEKEKCVTAESSEC